MTALRADAVVLVEFQQADLDGHDRGLDDDGVVDAATRPRLCRVPSSSDQPAASGNSAVDRPPSRGGRPARAASTAGPCRPTARPGRRTRTPASGFFLRLIFVASVARIRLPVGELAQLVCHVLRGLADDGQQVRVMAAAGERREGEVVQAVPGGAQEVGVPQGAGPAARRGGRHSARTGSCLATSPAVPGPGRLPAIGRANGRLLQHDVGVGAAGAERIDARPSAVARRAPAASACVGTSSFSSRTSMAGLGLWKCRFGGTMPWWAVSAALMNPAMPAAPFEVAEVGFHRADQAAVAGGAVPAQDGAEGEALDGVADGGAGAVGLDEIDAPAGRRPPRRRPP